jgi:hypothetical protein
MILPFCHSAILTFDCGTVWGGLMSLACSSIAINEARERTIANVNNEVESKAANTLDTLRVIRGTLGNLQTKNSAVSALLRQRDRERELLQRVRYSPRWVSVVRQRPWR